MLAFFIKISYINKISEVFQFIDTNYIDITQVSRYCFIDIHSCLLLL